MFIGMLPIIRFLHFYMQGTGDGHMQSLILGSTLMTLGLITLLVGLIADLINFNRKLTEKMLHKMEKLDDKIIKIENEISNDFDSAAGKEQDSIPKRKVVND